MFGRRLSLWRVPGVGVGADMSARRKHEEIVSYSRTLGHIQGRSSAARPEAETTHAISDVQLYHAPWYDARRCVVCG